MNNRELASIRKKLPLAVSYDLIKYNFFHFIQNLGQWVKQNKAHDKIADSMQDIIRNA